MEQWRELAPIVLLVVFIFEHLGRTQRFEYVRPSYYLGGIVWIIRTVVRWGAVLYAHVATFPSIIQLLEVYQTLKDLIMPFVDLLNLPFDWHQSAVDTAKAVASVDHMRVGTAFFGVLGAAWYYELARDFYLLVGGALIGLMVLIHTISIRTRAPSPPPPTTPPASPPAPLPASPEPVRRRRRQELVVRT